MMIDFLAIEQCALASWPAAVVEPCDGWQMRFTYGVTSRANSVWTNDTNGRLSLDDKIATAEAFYAQHHAPARFQVNPHSQPLGLAEQLIERGYQGVGPTQVQTAVSARALQTLPEPNTAVQYQLDSTLSSDWLAFHQAANQFDAHVLAERKGILDRIRIPVVYLSAWLNGRIVGIGTAVSHQGWLCISNMLVDPDARRMGIAIGLLGQLLQWGEANNAPNSFLQVVASNQAAINLYQKIGFQYQYTYEYFSKSEL
jgi:GNAT superfamily N-acetyltransferase